MITLKHNGEYAHSETRTFGQACELLDGVLHDAGYTKQDEFQIRPTQKVQWRAESCGFKAINVAGHAVRIRVRPGDNATVWEYTLTPPHGHSPHTLLERLNQVAEVRERERMKKEARDKQVETQSTPAMLKANGVGTHPTLVSPTVPAKVDLLQRLGSLVETKGRIEKRKETIDMLEKRKAELQAEIEDLRNAINRVDSEIMAVMEEDEKDTDAKEAAKLVEMLEGFLARKG